MDTTWNRYLPRYMKKFGYASILIRNKEGAGYDYWVIPDPKQIDIAQEIVLNKPNTSFIKFPLHSKKCKIKCP